MHALKMLLVLAATSANNQLDVVVSEAVQTILPRFCKGCRIQQKEVGVKVRDAKAKLPGQKGQNL
jgi:hypothetical protein